MNARDAEVMEVLKSYHQKQIRVHLLGPLISLGLHVVLLVSLGTIFTSNRHETTTKAVSVTMRVVELKQLDPVILQDLEERAEKSDAPVPTVAIPAMSPELQSVFTPLESSPERAGPDSPSEVASMDEGLSELGSGLEGLSLARLDTPLSLPQAFAARATETSRERGRQKFGGSTRTEDAVISALRWLKDHQNEDGSWSKTKPAAMTALGLLAFMAHGENPASEEFGETVRQSAKCLVDTMMAIPEDTPPTDEYWPYRNGMMTYALAEAYALSRIPFIKIAMEKGLRFIVAGQQPGGGWDYQYCQGARWDLTATTWQIQALKAAYAAGADTPGLYDAMERGARFLKDTAWLNGNFQWVPLYPGDWGVQGCGVLCLQLTGYGQSKEAKVIVERVYEHGMTQFDSVEDKLFWEQHNPYYDWYYETQVMFHAGQRTWRKWNENFSEALIKTQHEDGHWEIPGENSQRVEHAPFQTTALNCLSLQIYYRYLPSYKEPEKIERRSHDLIDELTGDVNLQIRQGVTP